MSGQLITFEGCEGSGKSTQASLLAQALRARLDALVVLTREPGGSPGAEKIRELLLDRANNWDGLTEVMLLMASRRDHVCSRIAPALSDGSWVVCDRLADSTLAYQGHGRGISSPMLLMLNRVVLGGRQPDLTIVLDVPVDLGLHRRRQCVDALDRFESEDLSFHRRVRSGFLTIASQNPARCTVVDATASVEQVHGEVLRAVLSRWPALDAAGRV